MDVNFANHETMNIIGSRLSASALTAVLAALLTAVLVSACGVGGPSSRPSLRATIAEDGQGQAIEVTSGPETIVFQGSMTTDNTCQQIRAKLDTFSEGQGIVDLVIEAETLEGCPNDQTTTWNYAGRMLSVAAGEYAVTMEHRFRNSDRPSEVVFEGTLTVPAQ